MTSLILRELTDKDEQAFLRGMEDWQGQDLSWYTFEWKPGMSHAEHLLILKNAKDRNKIPANRVPSTMLYGFVDGEIVGRLSIRHELNDFLKERGGHVGYSVSPRHRQKGYATEIFKQGLQYCKTLGLSKILVTCSDNNVPSWKIIEKFGGSLENRIFDTEKNEFVRRYWVEIEMALKGNIKAKDKAVAYITRVKDGKTQLLVFDHDEKYADAGTQVPAGTVDPGEDPAQTVLRETFEESGLQNLKIESKIDEYQFFGDYAKAFLHRHVFHLTSSEAIADRWTHKVQGSGDDEGHNFHYFWIDLADAKGRLSGRFDDSIDILIFKSKT
ncbi:GNAT family N-acetyltransferase [Bdellovibrio bacteriovorus]|uniref:GNAT family N-acetyltransferase n=1 Tax=Bdellovibrio TaxID=958 RepID=UPI0035A98B7D